MRQGAAASPRLGAGRPQSGDGFLARLAGIPGLKVRVQEPLSRYTSLRIGGNADYFAIPSSPAALSAALQAAWEAGCPVTIMGGGTNLLVADAGVRGMVVRLGRELGAVAWDGPCVEAQAGASLPALARQALERSLSGLEFAAGIPGTLGGAIAMNAGAHDGDMARLVEKVEAVRLDGSRLSLDAAACQFRYRGSRFLTGEGLIVVSSRLRLAPGDPAAIREKMGYYLDRRRRTQPLGTKNAGSIFKNPPGDYAGRLIEEAGCKGWREGKAEVSPLHANFIVNTGGATAAEVFQLVQRVRRRVQERFGITLELEVGLLGFPEGGNGIGV